MNNSNSYNPNGYHDPAGPNLEDDYFDIKRYISLFISNWYWFGISLFIASTVVYGINRYSERIYTVSSTLLIKDEKIGGGFSSTDNIMPGSNLFNSKPNLKNEIGILKSYRLNKRVIDSLPEFRIVYYGVGKRNIVIKKLYKNSCPFLVKPIRIESQPPGIKLNVSIESDTTLIIEFEGSKGKISPIRFGERFEKNGFDFEIVLRDPEHYKYNPDASNKYYFYFEAAENLANSYLGGLGVIQMDKDATLITLTSTGPVAAQEVDYLNKLMELYISQGLESKRQIADSTSKFIDRQLKLILDSLVNAEDSLQYFRQENSLADLSKEGALIQNRLERLENERTTLEVQYQYFQYLKEYLKTRNESGDIVSPSVMGITDQALARLVQDLGSMQLKQKELSMNLSGELPPLSLIQENVINIKKALSENIESNIINLTQSIEDINKRISVVNKEILKIPVTERKRINIQRKFDINNTVYTYLLEKSAETGIARASTVSDNKIVDEANIVNSYQVKPKPSGNNLKALLLGFLIPVIIIALLYYFNNKVLDNNDILKRTHVPIIGYISHNEYKKELPVLDSPGSSLSESFRAVRTTLKYLIKDNQNPVIAVTSTISSEGKTFISVNLATVTSLLGKKVLLIGLDLRKPRIHKILGLDNEKGMSSYLSSNCEFEDVIKETSIKNLYYATSGPIPPNPAELIDDDRMKMFIDRAKREFDYIFIDTPPVAVVSDTLLLSNFVDINLFIVRQRYSSKNTIELIEELYKSEKLNNMGIVINDISLTGYYGYGLRYGYYKGYGYSYGKNYYGQYSYSKYGYSDKEHGYYNT